MRIRCSVLLLVVALVVVDESVQNHSSVDLNWLYEQHERVILEHTFPDPNIV
ncbi:hypothetical protein D3C80_2217460 [compost metagenome]